LERHGGTVEKFIGDAVMAVFGVPNVHEDDALRAVRAAGEMREALVALNKELERDHGVSLAARIGVNTGEVVAGDPQGQTLVTGDAVNVAARLEQAAEPGSVLLGGDTMRLVRDAVAAEFLGAVQSEATVLRGRCLPYGEGITFFPVGEVVKEAAGLDDFDAPEEIERKICAVLGDEERGAACATLAQLFGAADHDSAA